MANLVATDEQNYIDIANAIREKNGEETLYLPSEMAEAILNIKTISENTIFCSRFTGTIDTGMSNIKTIVLARYSYLSQSSGVAWACLWWNIAYSEYNVAIIRQVYNTSTGKSSFSIVSNISGQLTDASIRKYFQVDGSTITWAGTSDNSTHMNGIYWLIVE